MVKLEAAYSAAENCSSSSNTMLHLDVMQLVLQVVALEGFTSKGLMHTVSYTYSSL